jgi:hypothetical protein
MQIGGSQDFVHKDSLDLQKITASHLQLFVGVTLDSQNFKRVPDKYESDTAVNKFCSLHHIKIL